MVNEAPPSSFSFSLSLDRVTRRSVRSLKEILRHLGADLITLCAVFESERELGTWGPKQ